MKNVLKIQLQIQKNRNEKIKKYLIQKNLNFYAKIKLKILFCE